MSRIQYFKSTQQIAAERESQGANVSGAPCPPPPTSAKPPKPSYGVLVWASWLAYALFFGQQPIFVFSGQLATSVQVVCYSVSLAACIWWFVVSRKRSRRGILRRVLGYFGPPSRRARKFLHRKQSNPLQRSRRLQDIHRFFTALSGDLFQGGPAQRVDARNHKSHARSFTLGLNRS